MKGIILAGGSGTRLFPLTKASSKQLLPVYDKPMIYYPLSLLMLAGIKDFLIITTPHDLAGFENLLNDGSHLGLNISYKTQEKPTGIAEAFIIGEDFIGEDSVCFILGDNIFYGHGLPNLLKKAIHENVGATIFGQYVNDPERYGVATYNSNGDVLSIEEKPKNPKSNMAVTGLYIYDNNVSNVAKSITPSDRGELEITDVNKKYLKDKKLSLKVLGRGTAWLDTGTHESLHSASVFIEVIEKRQSLKIACLEEIAYRMKFISKANLLDEANKYNNDYGYYLKKVAEEIV
ncbi:MAG: glucose-1-phosphate thymidylyltransferase [Rickettsiales bacterium]|nr:glucose-1-phosphate thymidylyltransferase [Rickettsiales bacterium]|tara:strand:+ start:1617 stop:2486 length:870 start_codon:yes stop_codon:yes gene_type:complete